MLLLLWTARSRQVSAPVFIRYVTAALDMVDYDFLADVGVCGAALHWLTSILHRQGQRVDLREEMSMRHPLECWIPQGMFLFPMLFNIYMRLLNQLVKFQARVSSVY